jgi:DNA polymerase III epsilon subunit-like protein
MKTYCIIDIETVDFKDLRILEIGAVRINDKWDIVPDDLGGSQIDIRTDIPWPENHISGEKKPIGKYSQQDAKKILLNFIGKSVVVAFNIGFEERVLGVEFIEKFDLMMWMKQKYNLKKYNLSVCAEIAKVKEIAKHTALGDCQTILDIMRKECSK